MKRLAYFCLPLFVALFSIFFVAQPVHAASELDSLNSQSISLVPYMLGRPSSSTNCSTPYPSDPTRPGLTGTIIASLTTQVVGLQDGCGNQVLTGLVPQSGNFVAYLYSDPMMPSSKEYIADLLGNTGLSPVQHAFAQGTGYTAMSPFLPFWKVFRDVAYSLYIIMFVVVGIMIMLRTKISGQTIVTIQSALPNLLITLILITFSYAIVGFMIDLMYFLIYFLVYLVSAAGIISDPTKLITRFMSYSAWSVIFAGRNSIISAVAASIRAVLSGLGTGVLGAAGSVVGFVSIFGIGYLIVAIAFAIAILKLMFALVKAYVMLIVQTITAPLQLLMNAMPGSKSFSTWLKTTASYLIPFPVAAAMFIFSAILVGNPTDKTILGSLDPRDANPFGVNQSAALYQNRDKIWLPPFTLTDANLYNSDVLTLIGFFIFLMTPAAVKMAQDWLQVKESPYTAEAFSSLGLAGKGAMIAPNWLYSTKKQEEAARMQARYLGAQLNRVLPGGGAKPRGPGDNNTGV